LKQFSHMKIIYSLFLIFVEKVIKLFSFDFLQIRHIINNLILIEKDKDKEDKER